MKRKMTIVFWLISMAVFHLLLPTKVMSENYNKYLDEAIHACDENIIRNITKREVDVNVKYGQFGETYLINALQSECVPAVELLIEAGADPNLPSDLRKRAPIFYALNENQLGILKYLIEKGADVNAKTRFGLTPLLVCQSSKVFQLLVESGAKVNETDFFGRSPLISASYRARSSIVELLITKGADVNHKDAIGLNALDYVLAELPTSRERTFQNYEKIHHLLLDHGAKATGMPVKESRKQFFTEGMNLPDKHLVGKWAGTISKDQPITFDIKRSWGSYKIHDIEFKIWIRGSYFLTGKIEAKVFKKILLVVDNGKFELSDNIQMKNLGSGTITMNGRFLAPNLIAGNLELKLEHNPDLGKNASGSSSYLVAKE